MLPLCTVNITSIDYSQYWCDTFGTSISHVGGVLFRKAILK